MTQPTLSTPNSGLRVFSASLLSALLIMMPFVQLAAAEKRSQATAPKSESGRQAAEGTQQDTAKNAAPESVFLNAPIPKPAPEPLAALIVATKDDGLAAATTVAPGGTITYTVTINNNGADPATNTQFNDTIDAHTTLVAGSPVAAVSDNYNTIGNVQISVPAPGLLTNDFRIETGNSTGMATTAETKSSSNCTGGCSNNVVISADGSFTYNPPVGFAGTDTFTYTSTYTGVFGTVSATTAVKITVANEIWFIKNAGAVGGACSANCDGRLSNPFPSLAAFNAVNDGAAGHPGDNDWIFVFESATDYVGPATLRLGQKFIGQDATASLATLTGFPPPSGTDPLPGMTPGVGAIVNITAPNLIGISLNSGNTLRGFTVGDVGTGTKISGNNFGTLVVGNSASPDVSLNGTGRALNLTTGTLAVTGGFISVTTTSSTTQGINLSGVADSDGAGGNSFSFGSTTVTTTGQGILIGTTPADLNFGHTTVTGGTNSISFQGNSAGTRTFGMLTTSGASLQSFLHGSGGGNVTVTGAATLSSTGSAISVSAPAATTAINFQGATSATTTGAGTTAVNWVSAVVNTSMTFNSLSITRNNGTALDASGAGTINVTNPSGSITNTNAGGPAIVAANIALNAHFSSINSSGGNNGVLLTTVTGTSNFGTGQLTGTSGGSTFHVTGGTCTVTYGGNITQATTGPMVTVAGGHGSGGVITFSGTLSATLGTGLQFSNADGTYNFTGTTSLNGGDAGVDILLGSGGTFAFGGTTITNPTGIAFNVDGTTTAVTGGISISGTIQKNNDGKLIDFFNYDTGTATISGTLSCTSICDGVEVTNDGSLSGTVNFSGATKTLNTSTSMAVNLDNNDGGNINFTGGGLDIDTTSGVGFNAINGGTVTVTTGANPNTIDSTTGTALNVTNTTIGASPLTFRSINVTGNNTLPASGIILNATGSSGLTVTGNGGPCTPATPTCSGGTIQGTGSHGISFTNVSNIQFNVFRIHNTGDHGIFGDGVNNFTWRDSYIHDFGNTAGAAVSEDAMHFESTNLANTAAGHGLTGTVIIQRNTFGPDSAFTRTPNPPLPENKGIVVRNHNDVNLNMTVTGTKFTQISNDGLDVDIRNETGAGAGIGTATLNVDGSTADGTNTFDNINGRSINFVQPVDSQAARTLELTIKNNTFTSVGIGGRWMASGRTTMNARYNNNTMTNTSDDSIRSESDAVNGALTPHATVNATVSNNTMGGGSIFISLHRQALTSMTFTSNTNIGGTPAGAGGCGTCLGVHTGINLRSDRGSALGIDFQSNTGQADGSVAFAQSALDMQATNNGGGNSTICANVGGVGALRNTLSQIPDTAGQQVISIDPVGGSTITIEGGPGGSPGTENFLIANNTLNGVNKVAISNPAAVPSGIGANCVTSMLVQNAPTSPRDYLARADQLFQNEIPNTSVFSSLDTKDSVRAALEILNRATQTTSLPNDGQTASMLAKAVIDSAFSGALIAPTAVAHTAEVSRQRSEVSDQKSEIRSHHASSSKLETRNTTRDEETGLRAHYATLSKLATRSATAPAPMAGETVTANIGTLPAGGSVTITFQVTVNNPPSLTLLGPPRVENQGTVTADNGISVPTDDTEPTLPGAADKTATRIDLFDTSTTLVSNLNPSNDGDQVTFTATVNETPAQTPNPSGTVDFIDTSNGNAVICNDIVLTGGSAQCAVSNLSAGSTHNIQAVYSGDGNFDGSTSNTVAQLVNACVINPVVTNTNDNGAGSLRDALTTVCSAPNNNVTFNIPAADPGFVGGVYTITVLTELAVTRNVNITGPNSVTNTNPIVISGNNLTRVLNINAGKTATITNLTITNGAAITAGFPDGYGGGIFNAGTLNLVSSTVKGSVAKAGGGGIYTGAGTTLNITSSTISGNSTQDASTGGGGIIVDSATASIINSTISGNSAGAGGQGGGIHNSGGTTTITNSTIAENTITGGAGSGGGINTEGGGATVNIGNTIVANNVAGTDADVRGTFNSQDYNLIETVGSATIGGATTNNITGQDPGIGPLANNGGPTFTHRILANGSPVMDAGNTALTTDQRGQPRPKDNLSVPNASGGDGDDIGAYEAPLPPSAPDLDAASDTGASSTDDYTADNTPTFTIGGVETGAFVELLAGATVVASGTVNTLCLGVPCIQLTSSALADGTYSMTARQTVAGGLSPTSTGLNVTIDTGVPGAPTIDLVNASDSGSSNSDNLTNAATRTFDIGTETGTTVELLRDGNLIASTAGTGGTVQLSDSTAAVSGTTYAYTARQTDGGGNQATSGTVNVTFDNTSPTVSMSSVAPNPTNTSPIPVTVLFNESVTGFTATDITAGNATVNNFAGSGANYTFDLVPSGQGTVTADISAAVAQDTAGNDNSAATQFSRTFDTNAPTADITDVTPDPRNNSVSSITIVFSEAVTGFDLADLSLTLDGGANLLTGAQTLGSGDGGITWTLGNLSGITAAQGAYLLTLTASGSGITDNAGNGLAGNATDAWVVDTTAPTVTINQAAGQADPTSSSPINFTVVFSEPVTGFTNTDVTFSGAGATTATVTEVAPNDGTTYNVAISGMNADGTVQATVNVNAAQDGVGNNSAASTSTDNQVTYINAITINVQDAKVPEPASPNTIDMTFTVSLSSPAPAGGVNVNFTTNNGSATAGACGPAPTGDYTATSGQVNFTVGQQVKTINVPVCSDNASEGDETFTVTLSSPTSPGVIGDGTATGTITAANPAGAVLISELRTSGPGGAGDDFVEIYNNSNSPLTVAASDASAGYGVYKMGADCNATPVLIGVIPNGDVIPARGHYLLVGSAYSLGNYGGSGAAAGNQTLSADIETDGNVGLFSTSDVTKVSSANRLDAVGFGANVGGTCNLLREGSNLPPIAGNPTLEHSYFRKMCDWIQGSACTVPGIPKDTNQNADDFWLADTQFVTGRLGAPGPENIASPIRRDNSGINVFLLDGNVAAAAHPNRSRDTTPGASPVTFGTMTLRYRVTNNTGSPVTRLRYRVVDISTAMQPAGPTADLRALSSSVEPSIGPINDPVTCAPGGTPCNVTVTATTLEAPPAQPNGGGYNSTLSSGTITATPGSELAPGASILINFKLGVQKTGVFRFYIIVEALP